MSTPEAYISVPLEVTRTIYCQEWQPIERAPKDGNCILACATGADPMEPRVVFWYEWDQPHPDTGDAAHYDGWAVPDGNIYAPGLFTHWMPLPAMPD